MFGLSAFYLPQSADCIIRMKPWLFWFFPALFTKAMLSASCFLLFPRNMWNFFSWTSFPLPWYLFIKYLFPGILINLVRLEFHVRLLIALLSWSPLVPDWFIQTDWDLCLQQRCTMVQFTHENGILEQSNQLDWWIFKNQLCTYEMLSLLMWRKTATLKSGVWLSIKLINPFCANFILSNLYFFLAIQLSELIEKVDE